MSRPECCGWRIAAFSHPSSLRVGIIVIVRRQGGPNRCTCSTDRKLFSLDAPRYPAPLLLVTTDNCLGGVATTRSSERARRRGSTRCERVMKDLKRRRKTLLRPLLTYKSLNCLHVCSVSLLLLPPLNGSWCFSFSNRSRCSLKECGDGGESGRILNFETEPTTVLSKIQYYINGSKTTIFYVQCVTTIFFVQCVSLCDRWVKSWADNITDRELWD